jgi:hypothetical protein
MSRRALLLAVLAASLLSSPVWALPRLSACGATSPGRSVGSLDRSMCLLVQDPWQDCDEDPWQISSAIEAPDAFSDPWQDDVDPWQPVFAPATPPAPADLPEDPWPPLVSQLVEPPPMADAADLDDDPWQPSVLDPWHDDTDDPWQLP